MSCKVIVMFPTWLEARDFVHDHGEMYEVVKAGVGLAECAARTARVIAERRPDLLILAGFAGVYVGSSLAKGDTVLVGRENSFDLGSLHGGAFRPLPKSGGDPAMNYYTCEIFLPGIFGSAEPGISDVRPAEFFGAPLPEYHGAPRQGESVIPPPQTFRTVTSNTVNVAALGRGNDRLPRAEVENMEGAAFFAVCNALRVPFAEIRTISNVVGEAPSEWIFAEAAVKLAVGVKEFIDRMNIPAATGRGDLTRRD